MTVKVIFEYDEITHKWDAIIHGAVSTIEAKQAFNAVVLTYRELDSELLERSEAQVIDSFNIRIVPAVRSQS